MANLRHSIPCYTPSLDNPLEPLERKRPSAAVLCNETKASQSMGRTSPKLLLLDDFHIFPRSSPQKKKHWIQNDYE